METEAIPDWLNAEVADYDLDFEVPPKTILDIGANVGAFTLRCARRWPDARVLAYEPEADNAREFRTRCADLKNVTFRQEAVRSFTGQDVILIGDRGAVHGFHDLGRTVRRGPYVDCISSSEIPSAELIKIDTEGCELEILGRLNTDQTKAVVCEFHREEDKQAIIDLCHGRGFQFIRQTGSVLKFAKPGVLKKIKCFIGVPVNNEMKVQFAACLLALQADKSNQPCEFDIRFGHGDGVARTRNNLTDDFLKSDCTHMLQIDCDLIFSPQHVQRILSHDQDVVGGFYPKKQEGPLEWVINTFPGPIEKRADGLHKVAYIGTGFLCVKRRVFERMIESYPYIAFGADYGKREVLHDFWPMSPYCADCGHSAGPSCQHSPDRRRYLSEDWYFCQRWMDLGGEVFGDTGVVLKHVGPAVFPLITQLPEIANPRTVKPEASSDTASNYVPTPDEEERMAQ